MTTFEEHFSTIKTLTELPLSDHTALCHAVKEIRRIGGREKDGSIKLKGLPEAVAALLEMENVKYEEYYNFQGQAGFQRP